MSNKEGKSLSNEEQATIISSIMGTTRKTKVRRKKIIAKPKKKPVEIDVDLLPDDLRSLVE